MPGKVRQYGAELCLNDIAGLAVPVVGSAAPTWVPGLYWIDTSTGTTPAAPTLATAATGGGVVPNGTYQAVITFVNPWGETVGSASASIAVSGTLTAPAAPTVSNAGTGGTILAGVYQVEITYVNAAGETVASASSSTTTTGTTSTITINSPAALQNATGWYAYVTQAGGSTYYRQQTAGSPTAIGTNLTLTAPPTTSGANPPGANTAYNSTLTVNSPAANGTATGWYAYVTQAGGAANTATRQQTLGSPTAIGTNLTLTAAPTNTGATAPAYSTYAVKAWNGSAWVTSPAAGTRYLALLTADPDTSGPNGGPAVAMTDLLEDTTGGYARQLVTFSAAVAGPPADLVNSATVTFGAYTANQAAPVQWAALVTSASGTSGLLLYTWGLDEIQQVNVSQYITIPAGKLSLAQS